MAARKIKSDRSVGVIVFYRFPRSIKYLLLKHNNGHWAFAKGHPDKGEKKIETALREVYEEAGLKRIELISKRIMAEEHYSYNKNSEVRINKFVEYFIGESKKTKIKIDGNEITNYKWCTLEGAKRILTFTQSHKLLKKTEKLILNFK